MKRNLVLYILGILIFILSIIGLTYAFMKPKVEETQESTNISISSCAKVQLKDNGKVINLENTYPMDDEMGLETNPYEFTVASTCENYVGFNLYLTSLNDNQIADNNIHFAITSKSKDVLSEGILNAQEKGETDFNNEELKELNAGIKGTAKNIYKVYSNNIPLQGESVYQLYLWVDKDASNETMGQSFQVGLSVKSYDRKETLAEYLIKNKDNSLIYHDGTIKDENGNITDAFDYSYRYAGSSDEVKNYVCLDGTTTDGKCTSDDDLYRIIGLFKNDLNLYEMKLIKAQGATVKELGDSTLEGGAWAENYNLKYSDEQSLYKGSNWEELASYYWNSSNGIDYGKSVNMWQYSNLNKVNLNEFFYNYITLKVPILKDHITNHTWIIGGTSSSNENAKTIYDTEIGENKVKIGDNFCRLETEYNSEKLCVKDDVEYTNHIGLIYLSDYMYGTTPSNWTVTAINYGSYNVQSNNWLSIGITEWTISRRSLTSVTTKNIGSGGACHGTFYIFDSIGARPCFYLTVNIKLKKGEGSKENPYRLSVE